MKQLNLSEILNLQKGETRSADAKAKMWDSIREIRMIQYRKMYSEAGNDEARKAIMSVSQLEMDGGRCPKCGQEWRRVDFDNQFLAGHYSQPACDCYVSCPDCGRWLHDEEASGKLGETWCCSNCGWKLMVDGKKRYGFEYAMGPFHRDKFLEIMAKRRRRKSADEKDKVKVE